jgi:hypothetical protein
MCPTSGAPWPRLDPTTIISTNSRAIYELTNIYLAHRGTHAFELVRSSKSRPVPCMSVFSYLHVNWSLPTHSAGSASVETSMEALVTRVLSESSMRGGLSLTLIRWMDGEAPAVFRRVQGFSKSRDTAIMSAHDCFLIVLAPRYGFLGRWFWWGRDELKLEAKRGARLVCFTRRGGNAQASVFGRLSIRLHHSLAVQCITSIVLDAEVSKSTFTSHPDTHERNVITVLFFRSELVG